MNAKPVDIWGATKLAIDNNCHQLNWHQFNFGNMQNYLYAWRYNLTFNMISTSDVTVFSTYLLAYINHLPTPSKVEPTFTFSINPEGHTIYDNTGGEN